MPLSCLERSSWMDVDTAEVQEVHVAGGYLAMALCRRADPRTGISHFRALAGQPAYLVAVSAPVHHLGNSSQTPSLPSQTHDPSGPHWASPLGSHFITSLSSVCGIHLLPSTQRRPRVLLASVLLTNLSAELVLSTLSRHLRPKIHQQ
jgi:hypothetical protein